MERIYLLNCDFYRFESEYLGTNMYLSCSYGEALIVDPHFDAGADRILSKSAVREVTVFLTHEHPDHTCGLPWLKKHFKTRIVCQKRCADTVAVEKNNRPYLMTFVLAQRDKENGTNFLEKFEKTVCPYAYAADVTFEEDMSFLWHDVSFYFKHSPGHSKGSSCITVNDEAVFTGDNMIFDTPVITRFPGGNKKEYDTLTKPYLNGFSDETIVLAGHGRVFKMKEVR